MKKVIGIIAAVLIGLGIIGSFFDEEPVTNPQDTFITESESNKETVSDKTDSESQEVIPEDEPELPEEESIVLQEPEPEVVTPEPKVESTSTFTFSDIPSYNGTAYVTVNNNTPYFTKNEITTKPFEIYSPLDDLGRCGEVFANISTETMPTEERGSIGSVKPSGWQTIRYEFIDGRYLYNRCHLIGYQLAGENANEQNLITGTRYLNVEGMLPFENQVDEYVERTNNHVLYRVTPIFEGQNLLASGVLLEALSVEDNGAGLSFCVYCYNVQPGIVIDYANGESYAESGEAPYGSSEQPTVKEEPKPEPQSEPEVVTPVPVPVPQPVPEPEIVTPVPQPEPIETMVWVSKTGKKYHSDSGCSNMKNPSQITKEAAESRGLTPCSKCY